MRSPRRLVFAWLAAGLLVALAVAPSAQETSPPAEAPLFASDAPLELTLTFDVETVTEDRSDDPEWAPATLAAGGDTLAIGVRPRGFFRLHYLDCDVPPLRLNIRTSEAAGTVFAGEDKLKLVTHCDDGSAAAEQRVLLEERVYQVYRLLTDISFRTRLVRMTYRDTAGRRDEITRWGFLIEEPERLAERLGGREIEDVRIHPDATDRRQVTLMSVFHYLVGNTDWAVSRLHNVKLVHLPARADSLVAAGVFDGSASGMMAVPYDFDWAGVVGAPYASPDPVLETRTTRDRIYMGFCRTPAELAPVLAHIHARQDALYALFRDAPGLDADRAEDAVEYLAEFFEQTATERGVRRAFLDDCLEVEE